MTEPIPSPAAPVKDVIPSSPPPAVPEFKLPEGVNFTEHLIPAEYKDKPYMKDVTDVPSLFKKLDGSQELIGKRPAGIPEENAPADEWNKFYSAAGRPVEAKDYVFKEVKPPEGVEIKRSEELEGKVKDLFHKAGISAKAASFIQEGYEALVMDQLKGKVDVNQQQNLDFDNLSKQTFKENAEAVMSSAKKLIEDNKPEGFDPYIASLPNEALIVMAGVLNNIRKKYISEDTPPGGSPTGDAQTEKDLRTEARELMATKEYSDPMHPNHDAQKQKVKDLYDRVSKLQT